jgi:hypothetical protein
MAGQSELAKQASSTENMLVIEEIVTKMLITDQNSYRISINRPVLAQTHSRRRPERTICAGRPADECDDHAVIEPRSNHACARVSSIKP